MINGVGSYAQAAALKSPIQSTSFEQQNTPSQRAAANTAQPREAEIAASISSDEDNTTSFRREARENEVVEERRASYQERGSNVDIVV